jgi:hypothetical protein
VLGGVSLRQRIPAEQGVLAYWRGNMTNVSRVVPTYALRWALATIDIPAKWLK